MELPSIIIANWFNLKSFGGLSMLEKGAFFESENDAVFENPLNLASSYTTVT
jgi:hypothetical protein